jgi:hypothetical protein
MQRQISRQNIFCPYNALLVVFCTFSEIKDELLKVYGTIGQEILSAIGQ